MAVICPGCGRQYDVTLFEFGRTINCACGGRVGLEHRLNIDSGESLRFFADVNVARLVRWLRALGIDTAWEDGIADSLLVEKAIREKRVILTLDKKLGLEWRIDNIFLLGSDDPFEQLREVIEQFRIERPAEFFTRCLVCNNPLSRVRSAEIRQKLPANVLKQNNSFAYCAKCSKVFWEGSHTNRMRDALERLFQPLTDTEL